MELTPRETQTNMAVRHKRMYARELQYVKKTCEKFGKSECMLSQRAKNG